MAAEGQKETGGGAGEEVERLRQTAGTPCRELTSFAIPQRVLVRLARAGLDLQRDLQGFSPQTLARELNVPATVAQDVLDTVLGQTKDNHRQPAQRGVPKGRLRAVSAADLLKMPSKPRIVTMSRALDQLLGGGVVVGELTEVYGAPGVGKTQLGMQMCLNATIPSFLFGQDGDAIYIDTEGSISPRRMLDMATSLRTVLNGARTRLKEGLTYPELPNERTMLQRVHIYRVHDHVEQIALIKSLAVKVEQMRSQGRNVKVVVIDSVAFHFRYNLDDMGLRTRLLYSMSQTLNAFASTSKVAVVLVNQVTTKFDVGGVARLEAALGEGWAHACPTRVQLCWLDRTRTARLEKSPTHPPASVPYHIGTGGLRDLPVPKPNSTISPSLESRPANPRKRAQPDGT